jgi:hypothetical protein
VLSAVRGQKTELGIYYFSLISNLNCFQQNCVLLLKSFTFKEDSVGTHAATCVEGSDLRGKGVFLVPNPGP